MSSYKNFECLKKVHFKGTPLSIWKSKVSGLSLALAETDGPLVNGYFAAATESRSNDGCKLITCIY